MCLFQVFSAGRYDICHLHMESFLTPIVFCLVFFYYPLIFLGGLFFLPPAKIFPSSLLLHFHHDSSLFCFIVLFFLEVFCRFQAATERNISCVQLNLCLSFSNPTLVHHFLRIPYRKLFIFFIYFSFHHCRAELMLTFPQFLLEFAFVLRLILD